ncbi:MAG: CHAT domain-containing protein, partial [Planctomycetales bacterium]|nr:CHAT domain-containing protein [Planctomycetales bacterium]
MATRKRTPKKRPAPKREATVSHVDQSAEAIEELLVTRQKSKLVAELLGEENLEELRELSVKARSSHRSNGIRVLILPGIMGSLLGIPRKILDDMIWFDPVDIFQGNLSKLTLAANGVPGKIKSIGAMPHYLKLKLRLKIDGFDVDYFHYDWRLGLVSLGQQLNEHLKTEKKPVNIVAHSMGGLVARSAMFQANGQPKIKRLVMLGTPNYGSFEPVMALRGSNSTVQSVARLARTSAVDLANDIFSTFDGLCQLLPHHSKFSSVDLFQAENWPGDKKPRQNVLKRVADAHQTLAPFDERCSLVAGVNQETVVGLRHSHDKSMFIYERSYSGDGTVPLDFAVMAQERTYYVEEEHGKLPNNRSVAKGVRQILLDQEVTAIKSQVPTVRRSKLTETSDHSTMIAASEQRSDIADWTNVELREIASEFISAETSEPPAAVVEKAEVLRRSFQDLVISRRRQKRLEITIAKGDISQLNTRAVVLGMFQSVRPTGPASVLDSWMDGTISEFVDRRMFSANVGEIQILPTNRHQIKSEFVVLAGLGAFDQFDESVMRRVAENVARSLIRTHVDEIGTVLMGAGSKLTVKQSLDSLLQGFFAGLMDSKLHQKFRGITICEFDPRRFEEIKQTVYDLASTQLFEETEVTLDELTLPEPISAAPRLRRSTEDDPVYLIVRSDGVYEHRDPDSETDSKKRQLDLSVLTAGGKATIVNQTILCDETQINKLISQLSNGCPQNLDEYGQAWAKLVLPQQIRTVLTSQSNLHLVVVHDSFASRVPWETLHIDGWAPAKNQGVSRRYLARDMPAAAWLQDRIESNQLTVLLIGNPTGDLSGADDEIKALAQRLGQNPVITVKILMQGEATFDAVRNEFASGAYDVIHYAGHAFFDSHNPARSGIVCAGNEVLSGQDLLGVSKLPTLMFFNACESARVRQVGIGQYQLQTGKKVR